MTYQEIIRRVAVNLSLTSISSAFVATAKRDMYDLYNQITTKIRFLKDVSEDTITTDATTQAVASDFFLPVEVIFYNDSGHQYVSTEITREAYEKWTPNVTLITTSFVELVTSATPDTFLWTQENEDYDGKVGYFFTEASPSVLTWKPEIDGTVKIVYIKYDATAIATLSNAPEMHKVFHELLVIGITIKLLHRRLLEKDLTEIQLVALQHSIKLYQTNWKDMMGDFTAATEKKASFEVNRMEGFDFLNDRRMLL